MDLLAAEILAGSRWWPRTAGSRRPSGTEDADEIYAENFGDEAHLFKILGKWG